MEKYIKKAFAAREEEFYEILSPIEKMHSSFLCQCKICGCIYVQNFDSFTRGSSCNKCIRRMEKIPKTDFPKETEAIREKFPGKDFSIFTKQVKNGNGIKNIRMVRYVCEEHGIKEKRYTDCLKSENLCSACGKKKVNEKRYQKPYSEFLRQAKEIHGDKYIYPSNIETYYNNDKISIFCKKHNEYFLQEIGYHLKGSGCQKCGFEKTIDSIRLTTEKVVKNCIDKRGIENYDYSAVVWEEGSENINVICKKHGMFNTRYFDFIKGVNCPKCAKEMAADKLKETLSKKFENLSIIKQNNFKETAKQMRPEFDFSKTVWRGMKKSITFVFNGKEYRIEAKRFLEGGLPKELIEKDGKILEFYLNIDLSAEYPNDTNYRKQYLMLIKKAKENPPENNFEVHHIFPKSMFPLWKDRESNLVKLTYEDHYRAHYLLYKIYGNEAMTKTFLMMYRRTGERYDPEEYRRAVQILRELMSDKIYCYELDKEFGSKVEAEKYIKIKPCSTLSKSCGDWDKTTGGYHWCYTKDKKKAIAYWKDNIVYKRRTILYCYEQDKEYESASEAARQNGLKGPIKRKLFEDWTKTAAGLHWCKVEDKEKAIEFWNSQKDVQFRNH